MYLSPSSLILFRVCLHSNLLKLNRRQRATILLLALTLLGAGTHLSVKAIERTAVPAQQSVKEAKRLVEQIKTTRDLMVAFYERLQTGEGRTAALSAVQLEMLRSNDQTQTGDSRGIRHGTASKKDRSHPFFWASFIQSGDWRSMSAKKTLTQPYPRYGQEHLQRAHKW